jgi:hypothetical protein
MEISGDIGVGDFFLYLAVRVAQCAVVNLMYIPSGMSQLTSVPSGVVVVGPVVETAIAALPDDVVTSALSADTVVELWKMNNTTSKPTVVPIKNPSSIFISELPAPGRYSYPS